jgi:hypothetical protein
MPPVNATPMNPDFPDDFGETVLEIFQEMEIEEQITMILAELPDDVIEAIEDFEITHSITRDRLLYLATTALTGRTDLLGDACAQLIDTPKSFTWPIEDPLLCVLIAFMREHAFRWALKVCEKYSLGHDAGEPADRLKNA